MKIAVILIVGYFVMGFFGAGFLIEGMAKKSKRPQTYKAEQPPFQLPLVIVLTVGFLALPLLGYKKALQQGNFLHLPAKFWLWGPPSLFVVGVLTAFGTYLAVPSFFTPS